MKKKTRKPSARIRLAVIGAGGMGGAHAEAFAGIPGCAIAAVVEVDAARREAFARAHGVAAAFASTEEMLASAAVDAATVVTPDAFHAPVSIQCLRHGLHVLCEKPLALNHAEARRMVAAARKAGTVNMVNFSYRNWPCIHGVAKAVRGGKIGEIRHVEASYLQSWLACKAWGDWRTTPAWLWRLSTRHGSMGVLGDIGVHILDFATYPAGPIRSVFARLKAFPKARRNRIEGYLLDANDSAALTVEFDNGALGTIHATRWATGHLNRLHLKVSGTKGAVEIDSERSTSSFRICDGANIHAATWREVEAPPVPTNFERFIRSIRGRRMEQPDFARGAEIQRVLDASFASAAAGRPVRVRGR